MNTIIENWAIVVAVLCMVATAVETVVVFILEPNTTKIANLKEFLLWAVIEAEKTLGSGTGQLKLRYCYNLCIERFEWLPKIITFDVFSQYVDEALVWAKIQLESNKNIKEYVEGKE